MGRKPRWNPESDIRCTPELHTSNHSLATDRGRVSEVVQSLPHVLNHGSYTVKMLLPRACSHPHASWPHRRPSTQDTAQQCRRCFQVFADTPSSPRTDFSPDLAII
ncbi:hypothetical protein PV04_01526 [Phialophora macrospora]|uniref:Uncharacterized protein n=1 Tax=Phialophora macrospora TaxID=1851006 RepID=A0A0D2EGC1_9EURO|nr:hypothetical protein PV04_01526 [Phialophora macrospora]